MSPRLISAACFTFAMSILLSGCSFPKFGLPRLYKVTVQQGNVLTQEMIDQLKPGMSRSQVAYIMGEPILRNTFNNDRWDYVYSVVLPGYFDQQVRMSLFFENDVLAYFTGDLAPTANQPGDEEGEGGEENTAEDTASVQAAEATS